MGAMRLTVSRATRLSSLVLNKKVNMGEPEQQHDQGVPTVPNLTLQHERLLVSGNFHILS